jgi:hypothetical protein
MHLKKTNAIGDSLAGLLFSRNTRYGIGLDSVSLYFFGES